MKIKPLPLAIALAMLPLATPAAPATATKGAPGTLEWSISAGLGYDSNAYLSPSHPYIDYAQTGNPLVSPKTQSGFFLPIDFSGEYRQAMNNKADILAAYDFRSDFYLGSELENADQYSHLLSVGVDNVMATRDKQQDTLYVGAYVGVNEETYYDRDTGGVKVSGTTNVGDRYSYTKAGVEGKYKQRTSTIQFDLFGSYENRDYNDPVVTNQLDQSRLEFGGEVEFKLTGPTRLMAGYTYTSRDYDEKPARNLQGNTVANVPIEYTYNAIDLTLRHRLNNIWVFYLDYTLTDRSDEYVGYNDYTKNEYELRAIYTPSDKYRTRFSVTFWDQEYPNAFAYDDNISGIDKAYDGTELRIKSEWYQLKHRTLWGELKYWDENSSDKRYDYERYLLMAGVKWHY